MHCMLLELIAYMASMQMATVYCCTSVDGSLYCTKSARSSAPHLRLHSYTEWFQISDPSFFGLNTCNRSGRASFEESIP